MTVYAATVAAIAAAVHAGKPVRDGLAAGDLVLCVTASHKLSI